MAFRVFISSTMRDLDTERRLVRKRIEELDFEPVNAENFTPSGERAWERVERELQTSDVMVLILGSSYGWIPDRGPHGGEGHSVTHLEYLKAREIGLPVLAFAKRLDYEADGKAADAAARDAFRKEVGDWGDGRFVLRFEHGDELPDLVAKTLTKMLADSYQQRHIRERAMSPARQEHRLAAQEKGRQAAAALIPDDLVELVAGQRALLIAGAGFSIAAGLPTTPMFAAITGELAGVQPSFVKEQFSYLMSLETTQGRKALLDAVQRAIELQGEVRPTYAHRAAVRLFPRVVTTNFDELFEVAACEQEVDMQAVSGDLRTAQLPERTVIKLHGTIGQPDTMILTERDVAVIDKGRPRLWRALVAELQRAPLVVVGHSLRDPSLLRLFSEAGEPLSGYVVAPRITDDERTLSSRWGLRALDSEAEPFFAALEAMVAAWSEHRAK